jgi:hypothetical protein
MSVRSDKHPGDLHPTEKVKSSKLTRFTIHEMVEEFGISYYYCQVISAV